MVVEAQWGRSVAGRCRQNRGPVRDLTVPILPAQAVTLDPAESLPGLDLRTVLSLSHPGTP